MPEKKQRPFPSPWPILHRNAISKFRLVIELHSKLWLNFSFVTSKLIARRQQQMGRNFLVACGQQKPSIVDLPMQSCQCKPSNATKHYKPSNANLAVLKALQA